MGKKFAKPPSAIAGKVFAVIACDYEGETFIGVNSTPDRAIARARRFASASTQPWNFVSVYECPVDGFEPLESHDPKHGYRRLWRLGGSGEELKGDQLR